MGKQLQQAAGEAVAKRIYHRPHHRTTIITTTANEFASVCKLSQDEEYPVEFVNDIVSSALGGASLVHHSIRRIGLLRRQFKSGFRRVKVRAEQGHHVNCLLMCAPVGADDGFTGKCVVRRCY